MLVICMQDVTLSYLIGTVYIIKVFQIENHVSFILFALYVIKYFACLAKLNHLSVKIT